MNNRLRMLKLVEEIMDKRLSKYHHNCSENITDLFFLEIEKDEELLKEYCDLVEAKNKHTMNTQFGKLIKDYWSLKNLGRCHNPQSGLIKSYEKHSN